jgi:hypothetical protein
VFATAAYRIIGVPVVLVAVGIIVVPVVLVARYELTGRAG